MRRVLLCIIIFVSIGFSQISSVNGVTKKYGTGPWGRATISNDDPWTQDMVDSYIAIHGTIPDGVEDELYARLSRGNYLYSTFGPSGQNKDTCDFVLAFKFDGNITSRDWVKSGDDLRWDFDGTVTVQDDLPDHTLGTGDGILTVSTTDGWSGVTRVYMYTNNFIGQFPDIFSAGLVNSTRTQLYGNDFEGDWASFDINNSLVYLKINDNSFDVSDGFVTEYLYDLDFSDNALSAAEVDTVLADYASISASLDLSEDYVINLGGTNAEPSASGWADKITLEGLDWAGSGGSITITINSLYGDASGAYSLRQLTNAISDVVSVRRSGDNAESDFTPTEITDGTLATWVSSGGGDEDGFVVVWYDQSGNGNDGTQSTAANQPLIVDNGVVQDIEFDGTESVIETSLTSNTGFQNGFTLSVWVYLNSFGEGGSANSGYIIDKSDDALGDGGFNLCINSSNARFRVYVAGGTDRDFANGTAVLSQWIHLAVVVDSDSKIYNYLNGNLSGPSGFTSGDISNITTIQPLTIGNRSGATDKTFDGRIEDVVIFNEPLTQSQITAINNEGH